MPADTTMQTVEPTGASPRKRSWWPARSELGPLDYARRWWMKLFLGVTFAMLYAPIFTLMMFSFNDSKRNVVWKGFTFKYYIKAWNNDGLFQAFTNSLTIAVLSTILSTIIGGMVSTLR